MSNSEQGLLFLALYMAIRANCVHAEKRWEQVYLSVWAGAVHVTFLVYFVLSIVDAVS